MAEKQENKSELKVKKIRRILLLQIDKELKSGSNKKLNIMINSKRIQDFNKEYNSYKILLSETTKTYSNFVELIDESFPKNIRQIKTKRDFPRREKHDQLEKSLNTSIDSQIQSLEYIPNKVDLGEKKFIHNNKAFIKHLNSPDFTKEIKLGENKKIDEAIHKSTKVNNKSIIKVIDKIIKLKLNTDVEHDDNITKNLIKLRKYCSKLIKKKKKPKKASILIKRSPSPHKFPKSRSIKKQKFRGRRTIFGTNANIKISLFALNEGNQEEKKYRKMVSYKKVTKFFSPNLIESNKNNESPEKNKLLSESIKTNKFAYLKEIEPIKEVKEKVFPEKRRKLSIIQTMKMKNIDPDLIKLKEDKKIGKVKIINSSNNLNYILKEPQNSSKFINRSKFSVVKNTSIFTKKNSLFDYKNFQFKKEKTITKFNEEQKEDKTKKRNKNIKHTIKLYSSNSKKLKIFSD